MSKNLISVIMPCHNSAAFIKSSIESVLAQSHAQLELIIIDDASCDNSVAIVRHYADNDTRVKLLQRKQCSNGPATPRNQGIELAKGGVLAFIDSDDLWHPKKLELQYSAMQSHGLNFLSSQHIPFSRFAPTPTTLDNDNHVSPLSHLSLIKKNTVVTSSSLVSRELLGARRFNQQAEYIGIEDYLLWLHLHQNNKINSGILKLPLVFYRLRRDSLSSSKLNMAKKIFYLLRHYRYNGKSLGIRKYAYFANYILISIMTRIFKR